MKFGHQIIPVIAIFAFLKHPVWAVIFFMLNELFILCLYLHLRPFSYKIDMAKFLFERLVTLVTVYHLFLFTDFANKESKNMAGNSIMVFICSQLIFMIVVLGIKDIVSSIHKKLRK